MPMCDVNSPDRSRACMLLLAVIHSKPLIEPILSFKAL